MSDSNVENQIRAPEAFKASVPQTLYRVQKSVDIRNASGTITNAQPTSVEVPNAGYLDRDQSYLEFLNPSFTYSVTATGGTTGTVAGLKIMPNPILCFVDSWSDMLGGASISNMANGVGIVETFLDLHMGGNAARMTASLSGMPEINVDADNTFWVNDNDAIVKDIPKTCVISTTSVKYRPTFGLLGKAALDKYNIYIPAGKAYRINITSRNPTVAGMSAICTDATDTTGVTITAVSHTSTVRFVATMYKLGQEIESRLGEVMNAGRGGYLFSNMTVNATGVISKTPAGDFGFNAVANSAQWAAGMFVNNTSLSATATAALTPAQLEAGIMSEPLFVNPDSTSITFKVNGLNLQGNTLTCPAHQMNSIFQTMGVSDSDMHQPKYKSAQFVTHAGGAACDLNGNGDEPFTGPTIRNQNDVMISLSGTTVADVAKADEIQIFTVISRDAYLTYSGGIVKVVE